MRTIADRPDRRDEGEEKTLSGLKQSGVHVFFANKPGFPYFFYRLNARNHRKIAVIDGKIGYVGGFNIAKEYLGKKAEFGPWKDYHLRMTGEGVADLRHIFISDFKREAPQAKPANSVFPPSAKKELSPIQPMRQRDFL